MAAIVVIAVVAVCMIGGDAVRAPEAPPQEEAVYRIIGEWEGHVAVFVPQTDLPETVYDTVVLSLPKEEQTKLHSGIAVSDETMLQRRLEDYLS